MRYGSVSSGIECAAIAWAPLGWQPAFLAEIDPFASTVLHHHHSSGRPRFMPSPEAEGIDDDERKARRAAIKAVRSLPVDSNGPPNYGDMTTFEEWPDAAIDLLIGGTPCQSYSVAGLREGLDDPRGSLTLTYAAIARRFRPRWLVWENVFGVLSHDRGRSFASLLGLLSGQRIEVPPGGWKSAGIVQGYERAYGLAWRVLDTQYVRVDGFGRAIPQRRRRVFVVGYLGDWRRAAAVLLEREGLSGNPAPIREAGKISASSTGFSVTGSLTQGFGAKSGTDELASGNDIAAAHVDTVARCDTAGYAQRLDYETENFVAYGGNNCSGSVAVAARLAAHGGPAGRVDFSSETFLVANPLRAQAQHSHRLDSDNDVVARAALDVADTMTSNGDAHSGFREAAGLVAHSLRAEGFDASEDGTGRGTPIVPVSIAIRGREDGGTIEIGEDVAHALRASQGGGDKPHVLIPYDTTQITSVANRSNPQSGDPCHPLSAQGHPPPIAFSHQAGGKQTSLGFDEESGIAPTLGACQTPAMVHGWAVRRLTTRECCRLQGVPADYFDEVVWRGKSPPPDGPIYKTLGNGFSANSVRWIGRRIEMVEQIMKENAA
ncbi:DNA cytosine methyltransferase [Rhizobium puerariae]|uniref:DNA (cytosine-5-)-methyltransferase n=1 Tax=Rhizobium puerariae TaxID=1585791 RepID=A0ABV6AN53_9HYPH